MAERRPLVEGLKSGTELDRAVEEAFVFQDKPRPNRQIGTPTAFAPADAAKPATKEGRVPLTTRLRADFARALKRASLERQLQGIEPNEVQVILEEALEPWLRTNGYLN